MAFLNRQNAEPQQASQRELLMGKFSRSRGTILAVVAFSLVNILLMVTNANLYFLFSAYVPMILLDMGMFYCGKYPAGYYEEEIAFLPDTFLWATVAIAGLILLAYLLCWIFSKKASAGWMIFALVLITLDTGLMFLMNGFAIAYLADTIIHICIIVSLSKGISACHKLKHLPPEPVDGSVAEIIQE